MWSRHKATAKNIFVTTEKIRLWTFHALTKIQSSNVCLGLGNAKVFKLIDLLMEVEATKTSSKLPLLELTFHEILTVYCINKITKFDIFASTWLINQSWCLKFQESESTKTTIEFLIFDLQYGITTTLLIFWFT